ncbi:MAG: hypothetical protein PF961_02805 [Planctomycetota bacterium]|jgi:hypothetical protein|nr:hypothetical protein [Planctomycetota bacterium]
MFDPKSVLGADGEQFARELQNAAGSGGFNPFSLLTGQRRFQSVFLAPPSPSLAKAVEQFLADGTGPLQAIVEQIKQQGVDAAEAAGRAKMLFEAAQGMLVVVLADDQGLFTIPQLFFGNLDDDFIDGAVGLCGDDFPDQDGLRACLIGLRSEAERGKRWPELFGGEGLGDSALAYWEQIGESLLQGVDEGLFASTPDRLADLAHWTARALDDSAGDELDGDQLMIAARCHLLAGEIEAAGADLAQLVSDYEPEDEDLAVLLDQFTNGAIAKGEPQRAVALFAEHEAAIDEILGGCYELALPRFKATAAAMASQEQLIAAAESLRQADRKAFRHDLNREPLWRIAVADPGPVLDTHAAAEHIDRSVNFVAKRLDAGTIPFHRNSDGELRIPVQALDAWWAMMQHFNLLD